MNINTMSWLILIFIVLVGLSCATATTSTISENSEQRKQQSEIIASIEEGLISLKVERKVNQTSEVGYIVYLNKREVTVINEPFVDLEAYFDIWDLNQKVVILSAASGGNGCPKKLILISFSKGSLKSDEEVRLVEASPQFGNCHESPTFIANSAMVQINFPHGNTPVAESWRYNKNGLTKIKPRR